MNEYGDPDGTTYGFTVRWGDSMVAASGHNSPDAAYAEAVLGAVLCGWARPRWWEFWRKDLDLVRALWWVGKNYRRRECASVSRPTD